mmetsp:Transcript_20046/g.49894  ORF Transcript_20046/g.49894 Transcript_20046/m.49894 type:complete len:201 (-) Transcript_20046:680-1282(-)
MRELLLGDLCHHRSGAVVSLALQLGRQSRACVQPARLLHARHHRQPRRQTAGRGLGALPQDIVRRDVPVGHAHLGQTLQAPTQVPRLVVGDVCEIGEERGGHQPAGVQGREARHGVPRQVYGVELDVRHVVDHRRRHAHLACLGGGNLPGGHQEGLGRACGRRRRRRDSNRHGVGRVRRVQKVRVDAMRQCRLLRRIRGA